MSCELTSSGDSFDLAQRARELWKRGSDCDCGQLHDMRLDGERVASRNSLALSLSRSLALETRTDMVHPGARKFQGGKKGPRQVTGKRQVKATLRPGPVAEPSRSKRAHSVDDDDGGGDEEEEDGEAAHAGGDVDGGGADYGYRQALRREAKPLTGFRISISGCASTKDDMWALAVEYGADRHPGLLANTTHLVTETTDSAKYRVRSPRSLSFSRVENWGPI